jgi:hypothetical protein
MAISDTLQKADPEKLGAWKAKVIHLMECVLHISFFICLFLKMFRRVLEQIRVAVEKHMSSGPTRAPTGTLAKLGSWLKRSGKDARRLVADQEEIIDLNRRLQAVVEEFEV